MFKAINIEFEDIKNKIELEKIQIEQFYNVCLISKKYTDFFEFKVLYEENMYIFEIGKANLLFHYASNSKLCDIEINLKKYNILNYKDAYFAYLYKLLHAKQFYKLQKCLNIAQDNNWYCYYYFDIIDSIQALYYNIKY